MNKLIKAVSLALLLCTPTAYCMEKSIIITTPSEPFTMSDIIIPDDVLPQLFKHTCSDQSEIMNQAKTIVRHKSVCKHWYHVLNPVAIRQLLNWKTNKIADEFINRQTYKNVGYHYIKFIADTLKDIPEAYNQINMDRLIFYNHVDTIKILLENGANSNFYCPSYFPRGKKQTLLLHAMKQDRKEIFKLLLHHGGNIYQDAGYGHSVLRTAITESNIFTAKSNIVIAIFTVASCYCLLSPPISERYTSVPMALYIVTCAVLNAFNVPPFPRDNDWPLDNKWPLATILKERYGKKLIALGICSLFYWYFCN